MPRKLATLATLLVAALPLLFAVPAGAVPSTARDYAIIARDIVPSGEYGGLPDPSTLPEAERQAKMYDALTPLFNHVTQADVISDFKPEPVGSAASDATTVDPVPHPGLTILRDSFDVPHIYGTTRDDVTWGAGWMVAEDRGLLLQQARYDSRVAAIDAPGVDALGLVSSLQSFTPSALTEREIAKQTRSLTSAGAKGRAVLHDIDVYLQGINAYLAAHNHTLGAFKDVADFTRTDIYAFNALKDQFVGEGGGDEAVRAEFLSALQRKLGVRRGWQVWNDLREPNDPEAPASVPGHVQFQAPPRSTSGNVVLDAGSLSTGANQALAAARAARGHASNALLVSGARSATHHPIMVAGPQIGYFYPGLTMEMDLEGPGISQVGAMSAPFPGYIFIGRSQDAAWSLTSAGLDQIDTYVETLCGHSVHRYMFDGRCRTMQFFDAGTLGAGTNKARKISFYRTVHGPVVGYARVHGRLVALARKRASYGQDVRDQLFYHDLAHGLVHNVRQFFRAAAQTPQTFNSFYMDDKDIGVFTSGLVPIRPANVDPSLPVDGRGHEEWRGYVSSRNHPQGINPPNGEIVNWNNRPQAGYEAPDDNWSLGALQRVDLLLRNLGHGGNVTPEHVVSAMNAAATQDVREITFEPVLSKLLHGGRAPSARAAQMLALLDAWYRHGASRLDRTDPSGFGKITDPGAAVMDTAWPLLTNAWAAPVLGRSLSNELASFVSRFDLPPGGQYTGWHIYMDKDLRTLLRERVQGKFAVRYCGGGNLTRCRAELWAAMDAAGAQLARAQGPNPGAWRSDATRERISFVPGLLPLTMRYTNRPSGIQQVLSFGGHSPQDTAR
ncbi:MAG: penicillin acylase family protein [Solirubrobacterales bacterium]|nr:penicillin acylase family protein [Solirubrobacterales bacterium]